MTLVSENLKDQESFKKDKSLSEIFDIHRHKKFTVGRPVSQINVSDEKLEASIIQFLKTKI